MDVYVYIVRNGNKLYKNVRYWFEFFNNIVFLFFGKYFILDKVYYRGF